ncbi:MlaC/ttg2D family ABC transporter substrate-binding protein [Salisaeta longa]|uniref:MlaC/ttg2D family ABC transporter substrate-binding protein n=1 Tax=Salisaeta longa TaxID=503170 RepID=UPI0004921975|nr:ABC transporter substrate-binding protein [Salisaeta longa]
MRHFRTLLLAVVVLLSAVPMVHAQSAERAAAEIRQMLTERDQQIKAILEGDTKNFSEAQRERLKTLINSVIDFRAMGKQALGPYWSDLSAKQQDEFVAVFRDIVRAQSLADLEVYNSKVTYDTIEVVGDSAFVRTITEYKNTRTPVNYILRRSDGTWRAEDIILDGVSTAEGYARSFQTMIRKRSYDFLMKRLRAKREAVASR